MSSRDSSLALNRTVIGVLLLSPGGDLETPGTPPPAALAEDVGDVAADADADVEPDRLLLLPLALLVALLAVKRKHEIVIIRKRKENINLIQSLLLCFIKKEWVCPIFDVHNFETNKV